MLSGFRNRRFTLAAGDLLRHFAPPSHSQAQEGAVPGSADFTAELGSMEAAGMVGQPAAPLPSHHVANPGFCGPKFDNPWPSWTGDKTLSEAYEFSKVFLKLPPLGHLAGNLKATAADLAAAFPVLQPDYAALATPPQGAVQALWVGHATVLVQLDGATFLTDPMFSARASPSQYFGPQRAVPPSISVEDPQLPPLDFVVLSHNHYDHLDMGSVRRLHKRYGHGLAWYVPLGLKAWFKGRGITNVTELDWWQEVVHPLPNGTKLRLALAPAQHWSSRSHFDRRQTLWGSWAVRGPSSSFWFAGDTAYCPAFPEIGERYGPFDLAAIPTGAYEPRGFMRTQHINPEEAVRVHREVRAKASIAIHCCTFNLTLEPLDEPPAKLVQEAAKAGLSATEFVTLQHGAILSTSNGKAINQPRLMAALT